MSFSGSGDVNSASLVGVRGALNQKWMQGDSRCPRQGVFLLISGSLMITYNASDNNHYV